MALHPVVPHVTIVPVLDPLWLLLFAIVFALTAMLAFVRPAYAAAALAFVVPFACAHVALGTTMTLGKAALVGALAGLCARREPLPLASLPRAVMAAFTAIILLDAFSAVHAEYRIEAVRETLKWIEYALYFGVVFLCYRLDPQPRVVRTAIAFSVAGVAYSAFVELSIGAGSGMFVGNLAIPRIAGALEGPNQLGGYLEIAIAVLAAWQIRERSRGHALVLIVAGAALALCFSRAALAGTAVALLVLAYIERGRIAAAWSIGVGVLAGYVILLLGMRGLAAAQLSSVLGERASDINAGVSGGVGSRGELWRAAITLWSRHPIAGVGAGNYEYELAQTGLFGVRTQANEWYLQTLAEGGVLLFIAVVTWLASIVRALLTNVRRSPWGAGALAATCAMVLHGFSDDLVFYPKVAELWMTALALGCAAER